MVGIHGFNRYIRIIIIETKSEQTNHVARRCISGRKSEVNIKSFAIFMESRYLVSTTIVHVKRVGLT